MTDFHTASRDYRRAKFATDWARGLVIYADQESLSILQPVEFDALERMHSEFERAEVAAGEELDFAEANARFSQSGGRHAGRE